MFFDFVNYHTADGMDIPFHRALSAEGKMQRQARCEFGTIDFQEQGYDSFSVWKATCSIEQSVTISFQEASFTSFHIFFMLKGNADFRFEGLTAFTLAEHHYLCFFLPGLEGEYVMSPGEFVFLGIQLSAAQLMHYSERLPALSPFIEVLHGHKALSLKEANRIMPVLLQELHELQNRNPLYEQQQFYIELKVADIVRLAITPFDSPSSTGVTIHPEDERKIRALREYIFSHLDNPGSLSDLAHRAGINSFKLKDGFKKIYGTTVFGFIRDERLHRAKNWLMETSMAIKAIANKAGFKTVQHFSAAFRKRYGFPPSLLRKELKTPQRKK